MPRSFALLLALFAGGAAAQQGENELALVDMQGGSHPLWSPDGRTLYFQRDNRMYGIAVDPVTGAAAGAPEALPIEGFLQGELRRRRTANGF